MQPSTSELPRPSREGMRFIGGHKKVVTVMNDRSIEEWENTPPTEAGLRQCHLYLVRLALDVLHKELRLKQTRANTTKEALSGRKLKTDIALKILSIANFWLSEKIEEEEETEERPEDSLYAKLAAVLHEHEGIGPFGEDPGQDAVGRADRGIP